MSRPSRVRVPALLALVAAAGCQDYNFNPVGHCVIQPGTQRVRLSNISTADVLFVIDDSGSMGGEQSRLAAAFTSFTDELDATNVERVAQGLSPIDFHLAVTTTSVFYNAANMSYCRSDCPNAAGEQVCCVVTGSSPTGPVKVVQKCSGPGDASCQAGGCFDDCRENLGEYVCCDATTKIPVANQKVACTNLGDPCGSMQTHYLWDAAAPDCTPGIAGNGDLYPQGSFVAASGNPRVIHFDKSLYTCATPPCTNGQGYQAGALKTMFSQNLQVGTCGSNEEQGLAAAKLAVQKAIDGKQVDMTFAGGRLTDSTPVPAQWLHDDSKLVLVFVGDEDDCSTRADANLGVVLSGMPGADTCVSDASLPADRQKLTAVDSFVTGYTTVAQTGTERGDRPVGAAFIVSARGNGQNVCRDETCTADICCDTACTGSASVCTNAICGGQAKGVRLLEAGSELRSAGADVVAGSICDPDFGTILGRIAEIVKPPSGLLLPSQPAGEEVAVLRIAGASGKTRKTCNGPAPGGTSAAGAKAAGYDWWFTATREQVTEAQQAATAASRYVYINHDTRNCEASPGETYSADYLGRLPATGCTGATAQEADDSCVATLGGRGGDWTCFAGTDGTGACVPPVGTVVGTCLCGARGGDGTGICPNG